MWVFWMISITTLHHIHAQYSTYVLVNRHTNQSSVYSEPGAPGTSDKAVDGKTDNTFSAGSCSHTQNDGEPWWAVDMGTSVTVFSVTITNRGDCCQTRLNKFSVYGSNTTFNPFNDEKKETCYTFSGQFGGVTNTFTCTEQITAKYLSIALPMKEFLTLCEVQIQAVCEDGTYGDECQHTCSPHCKNPPCDKFTPHGTCLEDNNGKCESGYKGDNCSTHCLQGSYGDRCKYTCSQNCKNNCAQTNGICNEGCLPGYTGDMCNTECESGFFGQDCTHKCYCKEETCHYISGLECKGGCTNEYTGDTCSEKIETTTSRSTTMVPTITTNMTSTARDSGSTVTNDNKSTDMQALGTPDEKGTFNVAAIAGAIAGVAVIVIVILVVVLLFRRKQRKKPRTDRHMNTYENESVTVEGMHSIIKPEVAVKPEVRKSAPSPHINENTESTGSVSDLTEDKPAVAIKPKVKKSAPSPQIYKDTEEKESATDLTGEDFGNTYENVSGGESKTRLKLKDVAAFIENMKNQNNPFADEYDELPKKTSSWAEADVSELKAKNRYINILPYDYNRVKLQPVENDPLSTYINASLIKDYDGQTSYIAALGSTDKTVDDTWRMIWETDITCIVMVTNLVEDTKTKCIQYWPFVKTAQYGQISVSLEKEERHAHLVTRTMKASRNKKSRTVTHYHYTAWPDKQAPSNLSSVLQLREIVKNIRLQRKIPILIHCSAGIGRTGTLIALDILLDQSDKEQAIDVYKCVTKLREQRTQMVQSVDQYIFLYNAFHEIMQVGRTPVAAKSIVSCVKSANFQTQAVKQYNFLENIRPKIKPQDLACGTVDNPDKNRDQNIIAGDERRVMLMSNPKVYINAVYVADYHRPQAFSATQLPLEDTVGHFWRMMFELKSTVVVCLEADQSDTWQWIPDKSQPIVCENMYAGLKESKEETGVTVHHIDISTKMEGVYANVQPKTEEDEFHQVKVFDLRSWTSTSLQERDLTALRSVLKQVHTIAEKTYRGLITIMCKNGATESGLYIALSVLVDNLRSEQEIDVFEVVKLIRKSRPQFITSQEQYNWLYQTISNIAHHN